MINTFKNAHAIMQNVSGYDFYAANRVAKG